MKFIYFIVYKTFDGKLIRALVTAKSKGEVYYLYEKHYGAKIITIHYYTIPERIYGKCIKV